MKATATDFPEAVHADGSTQAHSMASQETGLSPSLADTEAVFPLEKRRSSLLSRFNCGAANANGGAGPSTYAKMQREQVPFRITDDPQQLTYPANDASAKSLTKSGSYGNNYFHSAASTEPNSLGPQQQQLLPGGADWARSAAVTGPRMRNRRPHRHHPYRVERSEDSNREGAGGTSGDETYAALRDSFGNVMYQRIFPGDPFGMDGSGAGGDQRKDVGDAVSDVPWELRDSAREESTCRYFSFLSTRYFWFLIQWAARVTFVAMLVPAALINLNLARTPFVSNTFALTSVVIATGVNVGQSSSFFVQYFKAGCLWFPVATACVALRLDRYLVAWFLVYTCVLFLLALFTDKMVRRICLLLFNIAMVSLLSGNSDVVFPSRVLADWFLGAAFALVATLVPYPMLATRTSAKISKKIFASTATCFTGILVCFWAPSNTQRSMSMVRIRHLVRTIDHLIDMFDAFDTFTFYEVLFFERYERREVRKKKVELLLKLKMNLRAMERVINIVQEKPQMLDQSERCLLFRQHLSHPMEAISRAMENLLASLSNATMYADLRNLGPVFEQSGRAIKALQDEFDVAHRILFYEDESNAAAAAMASGVSSPAGSGPGRLSRHASRDEKARHHHHHHHHHHHRHRDGEEEEEEEDEKDGAERKRRVRGGYPDEMFAVPDSERMEEFVPLMTFFVFSIVNFWGTLREFQTFIDRHKPIRDWQQSFRLVLNAVLDPFVENAMLVKHLVTRRAEPEVRALIEATKVSIAMLISVIFFYYVDNETLLLSGPTIIAFVSGTNPVEAVQASAARLSGTLFGACLGFFAASLCRNAVDRVAALCVITFVMTFFRTDKKVGAICMYCNFVAVASLGPPDTDAASTIGRIQQNTFAIFIYCFISVSFFPVSPNQVLFEKRLSVVKSVSETVKRLMGLLAEASACYVGTAQQVRQRQQSANGTSDSFDSPFDLQRSRVFVRATLQPDGSALPVAHTATPATVHDNKRNVPRKDEDIVSINLIDGFGQRCNAANTSKDHVANDGDSLATMPKAFVMAPEDTTVQSIFADIFKTLDAMKTTTSIMPLAADEFSVIPKEYPLRATGDVHAALYRLCALIYTMACSWKTMREKGYFTQDVIHIFHNLAPIATDITLCLERFSNTLSFHVHHPSSGLSSELTKAVMQLRILCVELSARKERDLLAVIRKTRLEQGVHPSHHHHHHHRKRQRSKRRRYSSTSSSTSTQAGDGDGRGVRGDSDSADRRRGALEGQTEGDVPVDTRVTSGAVAMRGRSRRVNAREGGNDSLHSPPCADEGERAMNGTRIFAREDVSAGDAARAAATVPHGTASSEIGGNPHRRSGSRGEGERRVHRPARGAASPVGMASLGSADWRAQQLREEVRRSHQQRKMKHAGSIGSGLSALPLSSGFPSREDLLLEEQLARHASSRGDAAALDRRAQERRGRRLSTDSSRGSEKRHGRTARTHQKGGRRSHDPHQGSNAGRRREQQQEEDEARARHADDALSLPYGRREADLDLMSQEMTEVKLLGPEEGGRGLDGEVALKTTPGHHPDSDALVGAHAARRVESGESGKRRRRRQHGKTGGCSASFSDDRFTLHRASSHSTSSRSSSRYSGASSSSSTRSASASSGDATSSASSTSLVRFKESFTTPVTVLDAEGLHAFTLSLEMLTKELRRALFGLEEMLQSQ